MSPNSFELADRRLLYDTARHEQKEQKEKRKRQKDRPPSFRAVVRKAGKASMAPPWKPHNNNWPPASLSARCAKLRARPRSMLSSILGHQDPNTLMKSQVHIDIIDRLLVQSTRIMRAHRPPSPFDIAIGFRFT